MALAFSSNEEEAIKKIVSAKPLSSNHSKCDLETTYELKRCILWIQDNKFKKVALQFPDEHLVNSCFIALELEKCTDSRIFILADTSYGSCCVDEVAAEHVSADAIIHYGHSCLSPTSRLPVLFVFCTVPIGVMHAVSEFHRLIPDINSHVVIFYDTCYDSEIDNLMKNVGSEYKNIVRSHLMIPAHSDNIIENNNRNIILQCNRRFQLPADVPLESVEMFFIGSEGPTLNNLIMSFNSNKFYSYDPLSQEGRTESVNINQALRRRYFLIERAKEAHILGILVGTLGVNNYLSIIKHLKELIAKAGKKSYTIAVGKPNAAKLANFPEIEVFVLVACSENSLVDSREFYQQIITPFELEIALNPSRQWTRNYITNFSDLLPGGNYYIARDDNQELQTDVSLISGKLTRIGKSLIEEENSGTTTVSVRNENVALATLHSEAAGEYLLKRSWRGLEQRLGQTDVCTATKGNVGIASGYEGEGEHN